MAERNKLHVKTGDLVEIISGKYKDKRGKVIAAFPSVGKILVENINKTFRHRKPRGANKQGGISEVESPIFAAKAMLVCGKCNKTTRISKKVLQDGSKVRVCKNCGETFNS
ncbi:MAG: 50S ribosomal protein L24 [Firmicutes bacterium]|nr:50S ribosomal protein L24 [Bacillota bacterium]